MLIFIYTHVTRVIYSNILSIDEIMDWNIKEIVASSDQQPSQTDIDTKLASLKPKVLSALIDNSNLNPLHENLATKAELLTSLDSLYCHHPFDEIHFEIKVTMAIPSAIDTRSIAYPIPLKAIKPKKEILTIQLLFCYPF